MGRMTVRQMDYANERLVDAYNAVLGNSPIGNDSDRYKAQCKLVKSGKYKVAPAALKRAVKACEHDIRTSMYPHNLSYYLREELEADLNELTKNTIAPAQKAYAARKKKLDVKFQVAKDELMLGDAGLALTLIEAFRNVRV